MNITKDSNLKIGFPELRGSLAAVRYPAFVEPKYDGELNLWSSKYLVNKYGTVRKDTKLGLPPNMSLLGELFYGEGKSGALYELLKHKKDDSLSFIAFDMLWLDGYGDIRNMPLVDRRELMFLKGVPFIIAAKVANSETEVMEIYQRYLDQGMEGVVVKSLDSPFIEGPCSWVKLKHRDRNNLLVNKIDPTKERIEVLSPVPNGSNPNAIFNDGLGGWFVPVGLKVSNKDKANLKEMDTVTVEHQGRLPSGSLRHPVYVKGG